MGERDKMKKAAQYIPGEDLAIIIDKPLMTAYRAAGKDAKSYRRDYRRWHRLCTKYGIDTRPKGITENMRAYQRRKYMEGRGSRTSKARIRDLEQEIARLRAGIQRRKKRQKKC